MKNNRKRNGWYRVVDDYGNPKSNWDHNTFKEACDEAHKIADDYNQTVYIWHIFLTNKIEPKKGI